MLDDFHTREYEFEELQPVLRGVRLDVYISGTAVLANDPRYSFYVQSITLPGSIIDRLTHPLSGYGRRQRKAASVTIERPKADDHSAEAVMFRLLEQAIYEDEGALKAWQSEGEEAAA